MTLIVCIDINGGISFNNRRVSMDGAVTADILHTIGYKTLYIDKSSEKVFKDYLTGKSRYSLFERPKIVVLDNLAAFVKTQKKIKGYVYVDNNLINAMPEPDSILMYNWNRSYPSDIKLSQNLIGAKKLVYSNDFKGNSHDTVTKQFYK